MFHDLEQSPFFHLANSTMALTNKTLVPGRMIMFAGSIAVTAGAFIADWSVTHVFNPRWPPHAKFHNGQTMSLSVMFALMTGYLLFRPAKDTAALRDNAWLAVLVASMYCAAGLTAILFPGTAWKDPEFVDAPERAQLYVFAGLVVVEWTGYILEVRRMDSLEKKHAHSS